MCIMSSRGYGERQHLGNVLRSLLVVEGTIDANVVEVRVVGGCWFMPYSRRMIVSMWSCYV